MQVVSTSSGGQEALRALAEHEADILLLDLLLPDVPEPADLVREIRERWPATAILLMSNLPPSQLEKEAERLATDGWTAEGAQARAAAPVGARDHRRAGVARDRARGVLDREQRAVVALAGVLEARRSPRRRARRAPRGRRARRRRAPGAARRSARPRRARRSRRRCRTAASRRGRARSGGPTSFRPRSRRARAPRARRCAPRRRDRRAAAAGGRRRRARRSHRAPPLRAPRPGARRRASRATTRLLAEDLVDDPQDRRRAAVEARRGLRRVAHERGQRGGVDALAGDVAEQHHRRRRRPSKRS